MDHEATDRLTGWLLDQSAALIISVVIGGFAIWALYRIGKLFISKLDEERNARITLLERSIVDLEEEGNILSAEAQTCRTDRELLRRELNELREKNRELREVNAKLSKEIDELRQLMEGL